MGNMMLEYVKKIRDATTPLEILLNVDYLCDIIDTSGEKDRTLPMERGKGEKLLTPADSKPDVLYGDKK